MGTSDGLVYCLNTSGATNWTFSSSTSVIGTPAVADDGTIYFGSDKLYALNADGSKRWDFTLEAYSSYTIYADAPAIGLDGAVYVARPFAPNGEGRLWAVNPDGTLRWKADGGFLRQATIGTDGSVLASTDGAFVGLNPEGTVRWSRWAYEFGTALSPAAIRADGTVLIPVNGASIYDGAVQAITPAGSNVWRFAGNARATGSPVVGPDGTMYYGFDDGRLVALDAGGGLRWEYRMLGTVAPSRIGTTPALAADGTLYFSGEHYLHALGTNGTLLWRFDCGTNQMGSPLIGPDGAIYVGDNGGILYALEGSGAGLAAGQWPMSRRNARHQATAEDVLTVPPPPVGIAASFTNYTDKVLVTWTSAPPATHYVVYRSGTTNFADALLLATNVTGAPSFDDRSALAGVTYYYFVQSRNLAGTSAPTGPAQGLRRAAAVGEVVWAYPTGGSAYSPAQALDGTVVFGSSDGNLYAANPDGSPKWSFTFGGASCSAPSIDSDGSVYFNAANSRYPATVTNFVFALNANGQFRWQLACGAGVAGLAIGADGTVYVTSADNFDQNLCFVKAISPSGSNLWTFANGKKFMATPCVAADGTIYAGTTDGYIEALRPDGTLLWECNVADGYPKTPVIDGNGVLFTAGASFHAVNADGQLIWNYPLQYGADSGPSCLTAAGVVYAQADVTYYRFGPDGSNLQKLTLPDSMYTMKSVLRDAASTVYLLAYSSLGYVQKVVALSSGGSRLWEFSGDTGSFDEAVLGTNNMLYVPCFEGKLYALRTSAGLDNSAWPHPSHDPQHTARATWVPTTPAAPASLSATMRTRVTDARLTWTSTLRAVSYDIYRSASTNIADAIWLASVSGTLTYDDKSAAPEQAYTYWVKARNTAGSSPPGKSASGMRRQAVSGELLYEWNLYGQINTSPAIAADGTVYVSVNLPLNNAPDEGRKIVAARPDGTIRWQYLTGKERLSSPSLGADGTIYVGTRSVSHMSPYPSPLLALSPNGSLRWQIRADDALDSTPAIGQDGTIYVGSMVGTLYAVSQDGQVLWTNNLGSGIGTPAIGRDGTLYSTLADAHLVAVRPNGQLLWSASAGAIGYDEPVPGVALGSDGAIYVSSGGIGLKAFNPDGTLRWTQTNGSPFYLPPTIGPGDTILVGKTSQSNPILSCFNSAGSNVWNASDGTWHWAAAAFALDGTACIAGGGSNISAFSTTGSLVWQLPLASAFMSSPAIAPDGTIFVGSQDGKLRSIFGTSPLGDSAWPMFQHDAQHTGRDAHAPTLPGPATSISATDGTYNNRVQITWATAAGAGWYEVWRNTTTNAAEAVCLVTNVAGTTMFDDKSAVPGTAYFYWVKPLNGFGAGPLSGPEAGYRRIAVPGEPLGDGRPLAAVGTSPALGSNGDVYEGAGSSGLFALTTELSNYWQFSQGTVSTPAVGPDGRLYFWCSNSRFYGLDPGGTPAWWFAGRYDVNLPAAVAGDGALIIADASQTVSCFDPAGQSLRWQYAASSAISAPPAIGVDGTVYIGSQDGQLHALNADGSLRWRFRTGGRTQSSPAVGSDGVAYFGSDDRGVYAVGPDGHLLWAAQTRGIVSASPVIAPDGTIVVGSQDGTLYAYSSAGTELWRFAATGAIYASACVGSDGTIYFGTYAGWVHALNSHGQPVWAFNGATNGLSGYVFNAPLLLQERLLVPFNSAGLQALAVSAGPAEVNWPQFRHDAQRTARADTWLTMTLPNTPGKFAGEDLPITARFSFPAYQIVRLELLCGTNVLASTNGPGPVVTWSPVLAGQYFLCLRATDNAGNVHVSAPWLVKIAGRPQLSISKSFSSGARLIFTTVAGRRYQVQRSDDLKSWTPVGEVTAAESMQIWTDSQSPAGPVFYRVSVLP